MLHISTDLGLMWTVFRTGREQHVLEKAREASRGEWSSPRLWVWGEFEGDTLEEGEGSTQRDALSSNKWIKISWVAEGTGGQGSVTEPRPSMTCQLMGVCMWTWNHGYALSVVESQNIYNGQSPAKPDPATSLLSPFYWWRNWGSERPCNLPSQR